MSKFGCILDTSALLAVLHEETGADIVAPLLSNAAMSAVNWCETVQKSAVRGVEAGELRGAVRALGVTIVPFGVPDAEGAAALWPHTSPAGLSLADRACLALAQREAVPAITADRNWSSVSTGIQLRVIR